MHRMVGTSSAARAHAALSSCIVAAFAGGTIAATAAGAQSIRGFAVFADETTRAPGVIIVADDAAGATVARALTSDAGEFDLRLPAAGTFRIRALRIGYRPTVVDAVAVSAGGLANFRITLGGETVVLSTVTVQSDNVCGSTEDAGRVIADLWEQARTALTATQLSARERTHEMESNLFQFRMDRAGRKAEKRTVTSRSGYTDRPFVSASADSLASEGYVLQDGDASTYRAPDAAALLSSQFAATHCFQVQAPSRERPQWIGIGFRPTGGREWLQDIRGTLWLDRATSELRLLEFRYTGLPREMDDVLIGGFVEFARIGSGHWIVARWAIRMPHVVMRSIGGSAVPGGGRQDRIVLEAISVTGGEVAAASRGTATVFRAASELVATNEKNGTAPALASPCGNAQVAGATLAGDVRDVAGPSAPRLVVHATITPAGGAPYRLATLVDERGTWALPCISPGASVSLTLGVAGAQSSGADAGLPAVVTAPQQGRTLRVSLEAPR